MKRSGILSNGTIVDWHYRAEDGKLKVSWAKDVDEYATAIYVYKFEVSENGTQCLILTGTEGTQILYRVRYW